MYRTSWLTRFFHISQHRNSSLITRRCGLSAQTEGSASGSQDEGSKSWRENPNLKYWVIGVSAITGIVYRYAYKEREKKKLVVKNLPPLPHHKLQPRNTDIDELIKLHSALKNRAVVLMHLEGSSGAGKSQLARSLAEKLALEEEGKYYFLPRNLFIGTVNAVSLETLLFGMKKLAIAIGCSTKDWIDKVAEGTQFVSLDNEQQLHVIVEAIKEKFQANPNWVLILDDLKDERLLRKLFTDEDDSSWGRGTVIITHQGKSGKAFTKNAYDLDKGLSKSDAVQLLRGLSSLPDDGIVEAEEVVNKLSCTPLAIACAGAYISSRVSKDPAYSIEKFSKEFDSALQLFEESNSRNIIPNDHRSSTYAITALLAKELISSTPHFLHTFDLIGTCSPEWPIPVTLISLHLRAPEFSLPEVPRSGPVLPGKSLDQSQGESLETKPEEEVQEMFLSTKRLARNLESFTSTVKENYQAIKEMFNPPPMDMLLPVDGVLDMMRVCPLVTVTRVDPGGVETVKVNPVVHSVMSQLFKSTTAPIMEEQYLLQAEDRHNKSSFFRRLWQFDPQRTLQEYRNALGKDGDIDKQIQPTGQVQSNASAADVSQLLKGAGEALPEYRAIQSIDAARHYQQHTSRVLRTINRTASVCSQDTQTRTLARLLKPHLDHILTTSTSESLGYKSRAHALSAVASINSAGGNLEASIPTLERALEIEVLHFGESSLEVADTLTRLADVYSSLDDNNKARELLERALGIYNTQRKKAGEYKKPLEFARTMEALGAVYGTLGYKQRSKEYIERAFSYMQSAAPTTPDEIEGRRFACEVASTLTDLGHAYLSVGDAIQGRKLLDLAVTGLKNMYGDEHPEVVRALTVLGTAYTMQGNWQEGKKMRKEAGKLQAKLDAMAAL